MIRRTTIALAVLAACAEKLPEAHVLPLVEAEKSFEREAAELGVEKGFLANIAPDAVLLRPAPLPAAQALSRTPPALTLTWEPSFAEIAASGDLGYTTGPFQARRSDLVTINYGHYVSVWRKDDDRWHLVIDGGSSHPPPLDLPDRFAYAAARISARSADPAAELKSLRAAEDTLIAALAADTGRGLPALLAVAAPDLRYFPPGSFPLTGKDAVQTALLSRADTLGYTPRGSAVSAAGDLGYVYGEATRQTSPKAPIERGGYLRIWRRAADGRWRVALDLTITAPPDQSEQPVPKDTP